MCEEKQKKSDPSTSLFFFFFSKKKIKSDFFFLKIKERNVFLLNEYHHSKPKKSKPWPEDILRIRATIYKQRHVHSKHIKRKSKNSSSASQNLLEEEKEMAPTANPCSMTTSRTTTNNISSKSANDTTCNTTTYSSEESVEMSGADTAFNHHQMVDVSCGTRTLTSDAETNTYLNNSYAFINNEMSSGYIENEDDQLNDDEYQYQTHRGHPSLPPSFKNTNTKTKMMYTTTSAANSEYSSGYGVDFFNVTAPTFINNDNNENGQNSVGGRKRKKPTSSFSAARSKLSKRAAANNNFKKGGETEEEQPSNTALAFSMPHMLNMDAIFGIDGSVERDDEDTALSPNSYGITIASFKETKRM